MNDAAAARGAATVDVHAGKRNGGKGAGGQGFGRSVDFFLGGGERLGCFFKGVARREVGRLRLHTAVEPPTTARRLPCTTTV